MNTTYKQQIEAIQKARTILDRYLTVWRRLDYDQEEILLALSDAGSSLAALNISDPYKEIERLKTEKAELEKKLKQEIICTCICHIKGRTVMHFMPCCEHPYDKYINADGTIDVHYADVNQNQ